jgi:hypothetical protein
MRTRFHFTGRAICPLGQGTKWSLLDQLMRSAQIGGTENYCTDISSRCVQGHEESILGNPGIHVLPLVDLGCATQILNGARLFG